MSGLYRLYAGRTNEDGDWLEGDELRFFVSGTSHNTLSSETVCPSWLIPVVSSTSGAIGATSVPPLVLRYDEVQCDANFVVEKVSVDGTIVKRKLFYDMPFLMFNRTAFVGVKAIPGCSDKAFVMLQRQRLSLGPARKC